MSSNTLLGSTRWIALAAVVLAMLAAVALGVRSWLAARDAATQLTATVAAQKQLLDQADAREQQRDATLAKSLAAITQAKSAVKTPSEAATQIPQVLPSLPAPLSIEIPEAKPTEPTPPAIATVPQQDLQPLYDYIQDCRACQDKLATAQSDLTDERSKVAALTTERDAAVKTAHGGGFWSHLRSAAKWLAIGGAVGALAVAASRHISP